MGRLVTSRECAVCGASFRPRAKHSTTCGRPCYFQLRKRRAAQDGEAPPPPRLRELQERAAKGLPLFGRDDR
jgi:hypothetical protein